MRRDRIKCGPYVSIYLSASSRLTCPGLTETYERETFSVINFWWRLPQRSVLLYTYNYSYSNSKLALRDGIEPIANKRLLEDALSTVHYQSGASFLYSHSHARQPVCKGFSFLASCGHCWQSRYSRGGWICGSLNSGAKANTTATANGYTNRISGDIMALSSCAQNLSIHGCIRDVDKLANVIIRLQLMYARVEAT